MRGRRINGGSKGNGTPFSDEQIAAIERLLRNLFISCTPGLSGKDGEGFHPILSMRMPPGGEVRDWRWYTETTRSIEQFNRQHSQFGQVWSSFPHDFDECTRVLKWLETNPKLSAHHAAEMARLKAIADAYVPTFGGSPEWAAEQLEKWMARHRPHLAG